MASSSRDLVRSGERPNRGKPVAPSAAIPSELVFLLIRRVGVTEDEVAAMSKEQAIERLNAY